MRTKRWIAAAVGAAVLASAGTTSAQDSSGPKDFTAIGKATEAKEKKQGVFVLKESVRIGGKRIGRAKVRFDTSTVKIKGAWRLEKGSIKVNGRVRLAGGGTVVPIVDGTRAYKDATGKLKLESIGGRFSRETFKFD